MRQEYAWRSTIIAGLLPFLALAVIVQIAYLQNRPEAIEFRKQAEMFATIPVTYYPERGEIYDRDGHLLAGN